MLETCFSHNGKENKKIRVCTNTKGIIWVEVLELTQSTVNNNKENKEIWAPVHFKIYDTYEEARIAYLGLVARTSYENGNNEIEPNGKDNIFVRGSFTNRR